MHLCLQNKLGESMYKKIALTFVVFDRIMKIFRAVHLCKCNLHLHHFILELFTPALLLSISIQILFQRTMLLMVGNWNILYTDVTSGA